MSDSLVAIEVADGELRYSDNAVATLSGCHLFFPAGQWTCLLGRSGCGKSSLLKHLAGLLPKEAIWSGKIKVTPKINVAENIAYMAQQDLLLPWLNVIDNVTLSAKFGDAKNADKKRALTLLKAVGLGNEADTSVTKLSGGMRQRVALARTLMQDKPIVLMDEPFSALDAVTRYRLQTLSAELLREKTVILITHDPQEAARLAHQLYLLKGTPAHAVRLELPNDSPPRRLSGKSAELQANILKLLESDYE